MAEKTDELATRASLLLRLKRLSDEASWREFFDLYWKLIYGAAIKAGLTDAEAQDAVQETLLTVTKKIKEFEYDPAKGRFKGWLLNITRWRIADQFRKRLPAERPASAKNGGDTTFLERIPDPASLDLDSYWEAEWRKALIDAALERLKPKVSAKELEVFDAYVLKAWPVERVTQTCGVTAQQVYSTKHKLIQLLTKEVKRLENKYQ